MTNKEFLDAMNSGTHTDCGGDIHLKMHQLSQEALRITAEINSSYHEPEALRTEEDYTQGGEGCQALTYTRKDSTIAFLPGGWFSESRPARPD